MKFLITTILLGFLTQTAFAQDVSISKDGIGPFTTSMKIQSKGNKAHLHLTVRNNSGKTLDFVRFCVRAASRSEGCDFDLGTVAAWKPNDKLTWNVDAPVVAGIENCNIAITDLKARTSTVPSPAAAPPTTEPKSNPNFQTVHRIFVEEIAGNEGPIVREQLMASLANSGRFDAVDDAKLADAFIRGSAELRETGTTSATTNHATVGGVSVLAGSSAKGSTTTQTLTERIIAIQPKPSIRRDPLGLGRQ